MGKRFVSLDVMRGVAILGTLGTNIWLFTNPYGFAGSLAGTTLVSGGWEVTQNVLQQITQGKFLGLLTIMFGIGLAIQRRSAERNERRWPGPYPWRAAILLVDGILHFTLFTEFDVLTTYAITSILVAFVLATGVRSQRLWLGIAVTVHLALVGVVAFAGGAPAATGSAQPSQVYMTGSFFDLAAFRWENLALFRLEAVFLLPMSVALFLAGSFLFRAGVLSPEQSQLRKRLMLVGAIALPLDAISGLALGQPGQFVARYVFAPLIAFGILAAIAHRYANGAPLGRIGAFFHPIGKTALTCYVLQNVISGAVSYGWGLGLASRLDGTTTVPATVLLFILTSAALWAFATLWLRRFAQGPLEWLAAAAYRAITRRSIA